MQFFDSIQLKGWRQFGEVDLDLSKQVTILTGQNGCGKTTILNILSRHFGWNTHFVSTPYVSKRDEKQFWSDVRDVRAADLEEPQPNGENRAEIGSIKYDNAQECLLWTKGIVTAQYQPSYDGQQQVVGLHIPSHRPPAVYYKVDSIPTDPKTAQQHYQNFNQLLQQTYGSSHGENPGVAQKRSIISLALFGYGNAAVQPNAELRRIFESFQRILQDILPPDLGFERIEIRMPEVVLVTRSGEFALDAMSGGVNALFGMAWQIHLYGSTAEKCTVTIDEPENHLHPTMQRSLLPSLAKAFPRYRFIVATHSPFIVTSFPESAVYGLVFNEGSKVTSRRLDRADLAGTPNRVLREILDVSSNLPIWVEKEIKQALEEHTESDPKLRAEFVMRRLKELGLNDALPEFRNDAESK